MGDRLRLIVYEPSVVEGYEWVLPLDDRDFDLFLTLGTEKRLPTWKPVPVRLLKSIEDGPLAEADMPWLGKHALVLRDRAASILREVIDRDTELLPLQCAEASLWFVRVWRVIDALDRDRSSVVRYPSTGRIMDITHPVFASDRLTDIACFKLPEALRGPMYVTDDVVSAVEIAGLTGVRFLPVGETT